MENSTFFPDMIPNQNFGLPRPIMNYIIKISTNRSTCASMNKLSLACKLLCDFYHSNIEEFQIKDHEVKCFIKGKSYYVPIAFIFRHGIRVSRKISIYPRSNPFIITMILSKIPELHLEELIILEDRVSFNDFMNLTKSQTIKSLTLDALKMGCNQSDISIGVIISRVPYAHTIRIENCNFPRDYLFSSLNFVDHKAKISKFVLTEIETEPDESIICNFFKNNLAPNANIVIIFRHKWLPYHDFKLAINRLINEWEPASEKPSISWGK